MKEISASPAERPTTTRAESLVTTLTSDFETNYRLVMSVQSDAVLVLDATNWHVIDANAAALQQYGYQRAQLMGLPFLRLSAEPEKTSEELAQLQPQTTQTVAGCWHQRMSGDTFLVDVTLGLSVDGDRRLACLVVRDVGERVRMEAALRESEERFRALSEGSLAGVIIHINGVITEVNARIAQLTGFAPDELVGQPILQLVTPASRSLVRKNAAARVRVPFEITLSRRDGTSLFVEIQVADVLYRGEDARVVTLLDITHRKRAEAATGPIERQLEQQQKLESIGTLAAAVAHEINNPLTGILNYAELIRRKTADQPDERVNLVAAQICNEATRVGRIIRDLLAFSRQEPDLAPSLVRLVDVVDGTLALIRTVVAKDQITLDLDIPADLPVIRCQTQQIQQVLMNLVTNARDALNERYPNYDDAKVVRIQARGLTDEAGQWVRLMVEDHGTGIGPDQLESIFDPFFTTKAAYNGTGLGLAVCRGIVREHSGRLVVESTQGEFTRVYLDLPESRPLPPIKSIV